MTAVYAFAGILLLLVVVVMVSALRERDLPSEDVGALSAPERRDAAVERLREVEFDHGTGKLADEDYRRLRRRYARAALEARAEAEGGGPPPPDVPPGAVEEAECASCESVLDPSDRFCTACGAPADP